MEEERKDLEPTPEPETEEIPVSQEEPPKPPEKELTAVQKFYENFRGVPLKYIDALIGLCILVLVVIFVMGALRR